MLIAGIILYYEHWPQATLLTAHNRAQVGIIYVAPFYTVFHIASLSGGSIATPSPDSTFNAAAIILPQSGSVYTAKADGSPILSVKPFHYNIFAGLYFDRAVHPRHPG